MAEAVVDTFLKLDGTIKGESKVKGYEDQIEILSWSWGVSNAGTYGVGGGASGGTGDFEDLSFTHVLDKASANLMLYCASGKHIPEATMTVLKSAGDDKVKQIEFKMTDVVVTSISTGGTSGEPTKTEDVTLNFGKVDVTITPQKADQTGDAPQNMSWDLRTQNK